MLTLVTTLVAVDLAWPVVVLLARPAPTRSRDISLRHGSIRFVNRVQRRLVVTALVVFVLGVVVPVAGLALEWYLPMPRRWWSLLLFVATLCLPILVLYVGLRRLRRLVHESKVGRTSQGIVDHTG